MLVAVQRCFGKTTYESRLANALGMPVQSNAVLLRGLGLVRTQTHGRGTELERQSPPRIVAIRLHSGIAQVLAG